MEIDATSSYQEIRKRMRADLLRKSTEALGAAAQAQNAAAPVQAAGDTVTISDVARRLREADKSTNVIAQSLESGLGKGGLKAEGLSGETRSPNNAGNDYLEAIRRQIEAAEKQLQEATRNLEQAQLHAEPATAEPAVAEEAPPEAAAPEGETGPNGNETGEAGTGGTDDVDSARMAVTEASNRVLQLKQEMAKAMKERLGIGPGGGGQITGTRVGTVGAPTPSKSHIGEAHDPYAAAREFAAIHGG